MDFYEKIGIVCRQIPESTVATYGQIALLCGKPRNSRQVGYALKHGLAGEVPAHRVINSRGILSGAVYFDTCDLQKILLQEEGGGSQLDRGRLEGGSEKVWLEEYHGGCAATTNPI